RATAPDRAAKGGRAAAVAAPSRVLRDAEAGEDLAPLGEVPVAEAAADRHLPRRPRAAPQHAVALAEVHLRVGAVRERLEAGVRTEPARRPLPHVAEHLVAAVEAASARVAPDGRGLEQPLIEVGAARVGRLVAPRVEARALRLEVPRGRLLPLG